VPLRALGLGAGLLGLASCPLTLLGWVRNKRRICDERPVDATQPASPLFLQPPVPPGAKELLAAPLPLSKGLGGAGGALEPAPTVWGPPAGASEIRILRWGSQPPVWRTATPLSSRVGSVAKIVVLSPGSSQSAGMPWGRIRDSGTKDSPVIPFTRTSNSSQDRLVPGPRWIRPMLFEPVN
jgi:hypothetical protein